MVMIAPNWVFLFLITFFSYQVFGEETPKPNTKSVPSLQAATTQPVKSLTSADNRKNLRWYVAPELLLGLDGGGSAITAAVAWKPDQIVEFAYLYEESRISYGQRQGWEIIEKNTGQANIHLSSLSIKNFLTNSFYVNFGVGSQKSVTRFLTGMDYRDSLALKQETNTLGVLAGVGNHWQWRHFLLRCEWFGFYLPVIHLSSKRQYGETQDGDLDSLIKKTKENERWSPLLLRFAVGLGF